MHDTVTVTTIPPINATPLDRAQALVAAMHKRCAYSSIAATTIARTRSSEDRWTDDKRYPLLPARCVAPEAKWTSSSSSAFKSGHMAKAPAFPHRGLFPLTEFWPACLRLGDAQLQNCCTLIRPPELWYPTMPPSVGFGGLGAPPRRGRFHAGLVFF